HRGNSKRYSCTPKVTNDWHANTRLPLVWICIYRTVQVHLVADGACFRRFSESFWANHRTFVRADIVEQTMKFFNSFHVDWSSIVFALQHDQHFVLTNALFN